MKTLKEYIQIAEEKKVAIGHFNISNIETLWAIFNAARSINVPVIIGVSEGERNFIGVKQAAELVISIREEFDYPIFINADHSYSFERVRDAVDAGFDAIIFDGAELPFDENVKEVFRCVEYVKKTRPNVLVEGELGFIGKSSQVLESIPSGVTGETQTTPEDAKKFVEESGIDLLAPSVGNIHGIIKSGNPKLNIERIRDIRQAAGVPLVLHGGSGISDEDFKNAINAGISVIHINTEIRVAYQKALKLSLQDNPDETTPYKIMKPVVNEMYKVVETKLRLFNMM
jgi:fructose-bisphosphate aldolase class II